MYMYKILGNDLHFLILDKYPSLQMLGYVVRVYLTFYKTIFECICAFESSYQNV